MNTTTKWIASAAAAVAIFFGSNVKAQVNNPGDTWRLGIGVEAAAPTGQLHDISNFALGGTARLQYDTRSNISLMLTSGYYNAFGKTTTAMFVTPTSTTTISGKAESLGIVPVKVGIKAFASKNFYFSGEVGAGFETNYAKNTKLIVSPGLGYASNSGLDIGARYENFSGQNNNYGIAALRIAYGFKL